MKRKELLIIIPAYNEADNIGDFLKKLEDPEITEKADILVLNDASRDRTGEIVRARGHEVIDHVYNLGYGCGLWVGYKYAVKKGYRYVIQMDADGQHDVCNVLKLYRRLKGEDGQGGCLPDIVLGSRFVEGSMAYPTTRMKKIAYALFRMLIQMGTGRRIMDPTTDFRDSATELFPITLALAILTTNTRMPI